MDVKNRALEEHLRCAACLGTLAKGSSTLACTACGAAFPVIRDIPIVIDEKKSMFSIADCAASAETNGHAPTWKTRVRRKVQSILPRHGENIVAAENIGELARMLREESNGGLVLILGGGWLGIGCDRLIGDPAFSLVECDVLFGPRTNLVCDAHQIPFSDGTFDAVVAQGVFEYLIDPFRVAEEIHRVLRPSGLVYVESPFLQHVHGGPYDFFRFTPVGHRALFRKFEEVRSGVVSGPGTVLAWSYRHFLRSFMDRPETRFLADVVSSLSGSWMWRLDRYLDARPAAYDAASAVYFLGRRMESALTDREIVKTYRGVKAMGH